MLMVRLVLDLLARRTAGGPVPFLASIASWNPVEQDLREWLGVQLVIDHPALANAAAEGTPGSTRAAELLASGLVLPILDGLDEVPDEVRGLTIRRINDALRPGEQVVMTCRTEQYRDVIRPSSGLAATFRGAAAVQLRPLDADSVRRYLCDDAAGSVAKAHWEPVLKLLDTMTPLGKALSTPLMVGLARAIYNPRPGELAGTLRNPAELWDAVDQEAVESLLFDAFILAAYRHDPASRWKAQDAERWLVFLARHLERRIGTPDLAWWQLRAAASRTALRLVVGLTWLGAGLVTALVTGLVAGLVAGLATGLATVGGFGAALWCVGISGRLTTWGAFAAQAGSTCSAYELMIGFSSTEAPARSVRMMVGKRGVLALGLGVLLALVLAAVFPGTMASAIEGTLGFFLAVTLASRLMLGLAGVPGDLASVMSPRAILGRDRQVALLLILGLGLGPGLMVGLAFWLVLEPAFGARVALELGPGCRLDSCLGSGLG